VAAQEAVNDREPLVGGERAVGRRCEYPKAQIETTVGKPIQEIVSLAQNRDKAKHHILNHRVSLIAEEDIQEVPEEFRVKNRR
jgi:hypothetical protein